MVTPPKTHYNAIFMNTGWRGTTIAGVKAVAVAVWQEQQQQQQKMPHEKQQQAAAATEADVRVVNVVIIVTEGQKLQRLPVAVGIFWGVGWRIMHLPKNQKKGVVVLFLKLNYMKLRLNTLLKSFKKSCKPILRNT